MKQGKILITGALGQLGRAITEHLYQYYDKDSIILSDLRIPGDLPIKSKFELLNVMTREDLDSIIKQYDVSHIYHLAAILSAKAEQSALTAWQVNMEGLINVLEASKNHGISQVFWPSSIAIFGQDTPKINTPQTTVMNPNTVYGISKLAGERWCAYYNEHYNMDIRSLRFPGLIGHNAMPGGGTTDYAVEIFYKAINREPYISYLSKDARLPMMYMDDAVRATVELMLADKQQLKVNCGYNIAGFSLTPGQLASELQQHYPEFRISYQPDYRQEIAQSWPESIDDHQARSDWGWQPHYDADKMVIEMLNHIKEKSPA